MKKIYIFTLNNDLVDCEQFQSDLRFLADLICADIYSYEYGMGKPILVRNSKLVENTISREPYGKHYYRLKSDRLTDDSRFFNPMLVSENSFGITIHENTLDDEEIKFIFDVNRKLVQSCRNCDVHIESISYGGKKDDDEFKRIFALNELYNRLGIFTRGSVVSVKRKKRQAIPSGFNALMKVMGRY